MWAGAPPCGRAQGGVSDHGCASIVSWLSKDTVADRIYKNLCVSSCGSRWVLGQAFWLMNLVSETMFQGTFLYLSAPRLRWGSSPLCTHCRLTTGSRQAKMLPASVQFQKEDYHCFLTRVASSLGFT